MEKITSREICLASRPAGLPSPENFTLSKVDIQPPRDGQVLVRNLFMSVDPYMRGRMNKGQSYIPPFEIGKPLEGGAVGEVIDSRAPQMRNGTRVLSTYGWREHFVALPEELRALDQRNQPLSVYLGVLGMTGMTAWVGLRLVDVQPGEVIYISGAAGAVGSTAGQLAKLHGCRVIGSAGSDEKVKFLLEECGFDSAFNYKKGALLHHLRRAAPEGIDVYYDNVGGHALEAALASLRLHGRIIACGAVSMYNDEIPQPGPANLFNITIKRLTMKGMIVFDWLDQQDEFEAEAGAYFRGGKLKHKETVFNGLDKAVEAFIGLFQGRNTGKMIVKLD